MIVEILSHNNDVVQVTKYFLVFLFTFLKSRQNLYSPFGFLIMTIVFDQSEQGFIIPCFSISIYLVDFHLLQQYVHILLLRYPLVSLI